VLAICLQKIGETEIKRIIRLNLIIKSLILCHLYKTISMDISSSNRASFLKNDLKSRFIAHWNEQLGQNWVKLSKRINPIIAQNGFTNEYKKDRSVSVAVFLRL